MVDDFISKHDDKDKSKAEPKKTDNKTLTPDESNEIVNGLKKHFPITKDPQDKVFLTPDGEWIQLNEGDEHFIILGSITDKYISTDKARNLPSAQYFSHGLIRAGFTKDVTLINGTIPLNSKQQYALELAMIKKGHTTDNLVIEFPDDSIEKQLKHKLSKSLGESVDLKDTEWITVNGVHIPIKKGQNKNDVVQAFLDKHDDEPKKSEPNRQATKKDLTGFNGNVKLSMGKNIDMQSLDKIRNIWNSIDKSEQDLISNIKIRGSTASGRITAGEFIAETNTIEMTVHPTLTDQDYRETFNHEIGHARFKQLSPEKISAWNEAVKDIRPPTKYAKHHRDRATNYRLANLSFRPSDKEIIDQNIKMLTNLYYEEIHSEIHAHIKTGGLNENKIFSKEGLDKAVQLYKEIIQ